MYLLDQIREGTTKRKERSSEEVTVWSERVWEEPIAALRGDKDDSAEAERRRARWSSAPSHRSHRRVGTFHIRSAVLDCAAAQQ